MKLDPNALEAAKRAVKVVSIETFDDIVSVAIRTYLETHIKNTAPVTTRSLIESLRAYAKMFDEVTTKPSVAELYYAVKNDGPDSGWNYVATGFGPSNISEAADALISQQLALIAAWQSNQEHHLTIAALKAELEAVKAERGKLVCRVQDLKIEAKHAAEAKLSGRHGRRIMSASDLIADELDKAFCPSEPWAESIINRLTAAGWRLVGPDEIDPVTEARLHWSHDPVDECEVAEPNYRIDLFDCELFCGDESLGTHDGLEHAKAEAERHFALLGGATEASIPRSVSDAELSQWAEKRADDAGRLARELLAYRRGAS